ncbi:energy-coupling factor ABC transporter ATP-binding protein [Lactobacillus sp. YT155]|uniref:energy-coupling factor ABC transporter ATP-binding protein n=1 Tax=Lactobacillus sp. YT155 TaxID=3060955 RepID=UPI00265E8012|nr:energy-coupling factor ABC transporter ATP-binding protein [Lactobacillus sp. YT155]MDO1604529.1 energy-coupling factor ABC transporter ATP-binding protein [Lactobacillus sp. YT155]
MATPIIEINNLNYQYEENTQLALSDVSLQIMKNSWTAIVGQNGSGKSTLAKLLNGILQAEHGTIKVDDEVLTPETVWNIRKKMGIVFQNPDNQFVGATVEDDVAFGLENQSMDPGQMRVKVKEALAKVNMSDFLTRDPQSLSGGQKQRVAIAGVIALEPEIIILDEATSMLDPSGRLEIIQTIQQLKEELNLTVLSITHDVDEVTLADDVVVLTNGELLDQDTPEKVFTNQALLTKAGLELPFIREVQQRLIEHGVKISDNWRNEKELVDELWQYHLKK